MRRTLALSLLGGLAVALALFVPRPASAAGSGAANTFVREPILVYTTEQRSPTAIDSTSLVVYQDGFLSAATTTPRLGGNPEVAAGNIGALKVRSWYRALLLEGAATLPDSPNTDPSTGPVSTLTILEPGTLGSAHTFSFSPSDYPKLQSVLDGIILRIGI